MTEQPKELEELLGEFEIVYFGKDGWQEDPDYHEVKDFLIKAYKTAQAAERERIRGIVEKQSIVISEPWDGGYNSALTDILNSLE